MVRIGAGGGAQEERRGGESGLGWGDRSKHHDQVVARLVTGDEHTQVCG